MFLKNGLHTFKFSRVGWMVSGEVKVLWNRIESACHLDLILDKIPMQIINKITT